MALSAQPPNPPLELTGKIPLPAVQGRIAHLAVDIHKGRLFVAAPANNSVEVLDVRTNSLLATLPVVAEPQNVAYEDSSDQIFVTNSADGSLRIFDGSALRIISTIHLGIDPGTIRIDATRNRVYIGYGDGDLAVLDTAGKRIANVALKAHPQSFQFTETPPRLFINLPETHSLAVVDTENLKVIAEWPVREGMENFPMAIDEEHRRLFVACRRPARLLVFDMDSGVVRARLSTFGDADDLFYDPIHARVYVIGGLGKVAVYAQETADHYVEMDSLGTVAGARTGLFVSEWNRLFVAVREFAGHPAEIRIYQPH